MIAAPIPTVKTCRWRTVVAAAVACLLGMASVSAAFGGSATGAMDVRLRLESSCEFITGNMDGALLDFGRTAGGARSPVEGQAFSAKGAAVVTVVCSGSFTGGNAPVLTVGNGMHAQGAQRYLVGPDDERIAYDLYADPAQHVLLDPLTPVQLAIPTAGVPAHFSIYGRIPDIGDPIAGRYTDVVWLTLSY